MNTQQSAVALRITIVGEIGFPSASNASDSLAGLNVSEWPDGAQAFVLQTRGLYRLNKFSTQAAVGGSTAFVPATGGGVWFLESGSNPNPFIFEATGTASLTGVQTPVLNTWLALPSGSGFYAAVGTGSVFTFDTTGGIATYHGPTSRFRASAIATLLCGTAAQSMELAVSQSSATLIGTTNFDGSAGAASADPTTASLGECISTSKLIVIANNETIQAVMRNTTGTGTLNATHLNLLFSPA